MLQNEKMNIFQYNKMKSLQDITRECISTHYKSGVGKYLPPEIDKDIKLKIVDDLTKVICKRLGILDTKKLIYGPHINCEYSSSRDYNYDFNDFLLNHSREKLQNIVNNITKIRCGIVVKPIPKVTTHLSLYDNNDRLNVPDQITHIELLSFDSVNSLPPGLLSIKLFDSRIIIQPDNILRFQYLQKLDGKLSSIDWLDRLPHLKILYVNIDSILTNGITSLNFGHLPQLQHLGLYAYDEAFNNPRIELFNILGLEFLNLISLCLTALGTRCNHVYMPFIVTCEDLTLDFDCQLHSRYTLEFHGLIFLSPEMLLSLGYTSCLKHLHIKGDSTLFHEASKHVTSLDLQNSNIKNLSKLDKLQYLTVVTTHTIIPPPQIEAICIDTPEFYFTEKYIHIDLSHCTRLIGIDNMSKYIRIINIPTSVRWIFTNDNLSMKQFNELLQQVNIITSELTVPDKKMLDNINIQVIITRNGNYNNCTISGHILKLSRFASIILRDIPHGYLVKNMQELYRYSEYP